MTYHPPTIPNRLAVFISGSGSNLQAILDACATDELSAQVVLVVSNRKDAYGLTRARNADVPTIYHPLKRYKDAGKSRADYERDLADQVQAYVPDLLVLAGWMHVFTPVFIDRFPRRIINLHPALSGMFPGTDAIHRAYDAHKQDQIASSGCMVHYVVPEVDAGPVIALEEVEFTPDESLQSFEERMHAAEHRLIVRAISIAISTTLKA